MLQVQDLSFQYGPSKILDGIATQVRKGRILGILGPNGAGKTTFLKCITRIITPSNGKILIDGRDVQQLSRRELAQRLGYVPQHVRTKFPLSVFEMVLLGRSPYIAWRPSETDLERTAEIIREMNLESLSDREVDRLSGGQAQKVMLARALAQDPIFLLLDEPTSNLDMSHQLEVMELVSGLVKCKKMGAVIAMHDLNLAARFSDDLLLMKDGRAVAQGSPIELITQDRIREVYGVEAVVGRENGYPFVRPIRCVPSSRTDE
jgi:iron complex transport system ATP-binding protein